MFKIVKELVSQQVGFEPTVRFSHICRTVANSD